MAADMDPNDLDTVHHGEYWMFVGVILDCHLLAPGRITSEDWDEVTCRLCVFYRRLKNGAA